MVNFGGVLRIQHTKRAPTRGPGSLDRAEGVTDFRKSWCGTSKAPGTVFLLVLSPACVPTGLMWGSGGTRFVPVQARAIGTATNCVVSSDFNRINTTRLPSS
jgi:hypothetical protein